MYLKKFLLFGLLAAVLPAVAEETADRKTATSLKYVTHELDTRQNKFGVDTNKAMEYTNAAGTVQKRAVKSDLGTSTTDTSLPMVGGVNTKLNQKQDDIDPFNDHTAVTYTGQPGGIGRKGIYQATESYANQSDNLIDAKTFNAALKNGLDSEFRCSDNRDPVSGLCWLYTIHNISPNLFDKDGNWTHGWYINPNTSTLADTGSATNRTAVIRALPNTTYYLKHTSGPGGGRMFYCETEEYNIGTVCSQMSGSIVSQQNEVTTIRTSANAKWLFIIFGRITTYDHIDRPFSEQAADTMLTTVPLTESTPYEPYENVYIPQNQ